MVKIHLLTVHPAFVEAYCRFGPLRVAIDSGLAEVTAVDLRQYAVDRHGSVDDRPYGGGDGMVMRPEPLAQAIDALGKPLILVPSPAGTAWTQTDAATYVAAGQPVAIVCGRFSGIDQRFLDLYPHRQVSIGDFVISGGELVGLAIADSMIRLIPGALGHQDSAHCDSFGPGMDGLLEHPLYTRPPVFRDQPVPPVLLGGDHAAILRWRREQAREVTKAKRPDLLAP